MFTYNFQDLPDYLDRCANRLRIAVVHGGDSNLSGSVIYKTHNPRSTKTYEVVAHDVAQTLEKEGFQHVYVMADDMTLAPKLKAAGIHLVWLNTGGVQGYNPVCHTPALLEMLGMPYLGHNPLNSSILDNKHAFKRELQGLGFKTAPFLIWHRSQGQFWHQGNPQFKRAFNTYSGPFIVKPISGRASLNIHVVDEVEQLANAIAQVHQTTHNTALIETYLPGKEYCVAVCGPVIHRQSQYIKQAQPFAFSTIERVLEADERIFTSMDQRSITPHRMRLLGNDQHPLKQALQDLARKIYQEFSLNTLVRIDLRADESGELHVLEANPKPDLKRPTPSVTSLVAQGLSEYGMGYEDLILSLLGDRLNYLLTYHAGIIPHITNLLR